jgi:hypothetical protein
MKARQWPLQHCSSKRQDELLGRHIDVVEVVLVVVVEVVGVVVEVLVVVGLRQLRHLPRQSQG